MVDMKKVILLTMAVIAMIVISCDKNPLSPKKPNTMIRLKTGGGLNYGAQVYFMALSKNTHFAELPGNIFEYDKTKADWYIDGGEIPFTTDYKKFNKPVGEYYYLLKASGVAMMSRIEVLEGKQTWKIYASSGSLRIDIEQP